MTFLCGTWFMAMGLGVSEQVGGTFKIGSDEWQFFQIFGRLKILSIGGQLTF